MLKDHFLDYENHCSTTPIEKQLDILENHILELKNTTSSRKKVDHSRSRSRGDKLSQEFTSLRSTKIMTNKGIQPCLKRAP